MLTESEAREFLSLLGKLKEEEVEPNGGDGAKLSLYLPQGVSKDFYFDPKVFLKLVKVDPTPFRKLLGIR